jgi:hypothetical protein
VWGCTNSAFLMAGSLEFHVGKYLLRTEYALLTVRSSSSEVSKADVIEHPGRTIPTPSGPVVKPRGVQVRTCTCSGRVRPLTECTSSSGISKADSGERPGGTVQCSLDLRSDLEERPGGDLYLAQDVVRPITMYMQSILPLRPQHTFSREKWEGCIFVGLSGSFQASRGKVIRKIVISMIQIAFGNSLHIFERH